LENNTTSVAAVEIAGVVGEYRSAKQVGRRQQMVTVSPGQTEAKLSLAVPQPHRWNLDDPFLYTVKLNQPLDGVTHCRFRLRRVCAAHRVSRLRISQGYFYLNGRRIFLKSTHGNWYDPVVIQASSRTTKY